MTKKTNLQQMLLNVTLRLVDRQERQDTYLTILYHNAWQARNAAQNDVNALLRNLDEARKVADERQEFLERVAFEVRASGFDRAEDYLTRIWPEQRPPEKPFDRNRAAVTE